MLYHLSDTKSSICNSKMFLCNSKKFLIFDRKGFSGMPNRILNILL